MEILKRTALEQAEAIKNKEISAVELTESAYKRIKEIDDKIGAFNSLTKEIALETAKKVDEKIARNEELPLLAGVPLALKDNMNLKNSRMTCSSRMLENFVSPYDATVVEKLKMNLIPILGKASMDEFAMGSSNETSVFGVVHNPHNLNKVPGGSSGGSAASIASFQATMALGSDTGGSIRLPASFCGIVGLKPTYGRVSRYGVVAFASSLDQVGPLGRCVKDVASLYNVIAGADVKDSTSINTSVPDPLKTIDKDIKGVKIGVVKELMGEGVSDDVRAAIQNAIEVYKKLGAEIKEISLPLLKYSIGIYYIIATAEASSNLARFDGVRYGYRTPQADNLMDLYCKTRAEGFGDEVKRRAMLGTYVLSSGYYDAYYKKAQQMRRLMAQDFNSVLKEVDVLLTPTCPTTAFDIGSKIEDPISMYLTDVSTNYANLTGAPAMSIPAGICTDKMPIGMQIISRSLEEDLLLRVAYNFERETEFHKTFAQI